MPAMSTVLDQAHNALDRKLFNMKGLHHVGGSQAAFLTGLAHLYNLIPYQRRAKNAGLCGVEVEGGRVPISDWMLNLHILTSGGDRYAPEPPHHEIRWNVDPAGGAPHPHLPPGASTSDSQPLSQRCGAVEQRHTMPA